MGAHEFYRHRAFDPNMDLHTTSWVTAKTGEFLEEFADFR
jgi:hypothetical protein